MMNEQARQSRIWVALDESPRSTAALTAAAALAAELDAELAGLFVEDIDLQYLIGLPFAREFSLLSAERRPLLQADMERSWRREAEAMQRLLAEAAERQRLRWSFRVTRGRLSAEVSALAQAFDLIVLGKRTGVGVRSVAWTVPGVTLVRQTSRPGPVMVLLEDRANPGRSLDMGVMLARRNGAELLLMVVAADEDAFRETCLAARTALKERGASGRCHRLATLDDPNLSLAARREQASCLVLADSKRLHGGASFERMLDQIECPIVLTR